MLTLIRRHTPMMPLYFFCRRIATIFMPRADTLISLRAYAADAIAAATLMMLMMLPRHFTLLI